MDPKQENGHHRMGTRPAHPRWLLHCGATWVRREAERERCGTGAVKKRWISDLTAGRGAGPGERPRASASGVGHLHGGGPGGARSGASLRAGGAALAAGPTRVRGRGCRRAAPSSVALPGLRSPPRSPALFPREPTNTRVGLAGGSGASGRCPAWPRACVCPSVCVYVCALGVGWFSLFFLFFFFPSLAPGFTSGCL